MTNLNQVLSPHDVAAELGVNYETVLRFIHRGELPAAKHGQRYYVRRSAVEAFLEPTKPTRAGSIGAQTSHLTQQAPAETP